MRFQYLAVIVAFRDFPVLRFNVILVELPKAFEFHEIMLSCVHLVLKVGVFFN